MFGPASTPQTAAHIDYERRQCPGTGATYRDDAIRFMRELGIGKSTLLDKYGAVATRIVLYTALLNGYRLERHGEDWPACVGTRGHWHRI